MAARGLAPDSGGSGCLGGGGGANDDPCGGGGDGCVGINALNQLEDMSGGGG